MTHRTDDEVMGVDHLPAAAPASPRTTCTPRRSTAWTSWPSATRSSEPRRSAEPARAPSSSRPAPTATTATPCPTRATSTGRARKRRPGGRSIRSSTSRPNSSSPARPTAPLSRQSRPGPASATHEPRSARPRRRTRIRRTSSSYLYTDTTEDIVPDPEGAVVTYADPRSPQARQGRRDQLQGRPPRGAHRGDAPRPPRHRLRRGRCRLRRRLQADQGPARGVRPTARLQHADLRGLHLRHGRRGGRWSAFDRSSS
jgi:hypothetical protein